MPEPLPLHRRAVLRAGLVGAAATALVAGCDTGDEIAPPTSAGSTSAATVDPTDQPRTPDEVLVDDVLAGLTTALTLLTAARRVPSLRPAVGPLLRAHRQHVSVLDGEPDTARPAGPLPDAAVVLRRVRRSERSLQVALVDAAEQAESGALARLLASMSASVTQHLTLLPPEVAT